jgi:hypothetical protein
MQRHVRIGVIFGLVLVGVTWGRPIWAQEAAGNSGFDRAAQKLRIGDTVLVVDSSGREQQGKVLDVSPEALSLAINGGRRQLPASDIRAVDLERNDSLKNGALIGFGFGAGFAALGACVTAVAEGDAGEVSGVLIIGTLLYGGAGASLGMLVDALITDRLPVYRSAGHKSVQLSAAPLIGRSRKGIALTVQFAP